MFQLTPVQGAFFFYNRVWDSEEFVIVKECREQLSQHQLNRTRKCLHWSVSILYVNDPIVGGGRKKLAKLLPLTNHYVEQTGPYAP